MGRGNTSLSTWGYTCGAVNSPLTGVPLAWFERTPFVSVRDRRDPAASPSERFGASPGGKLEKDTRDLRAPAASPSERFGATPWGKLEKDTRDTPSPCHFGLQIGVYRCVK